MIEHGDWPECVNLSDAVHVARKPYRCASCPHPGPLEAAMIRPGQRYRRVVALWDGEIQTHRACVGKCPNAETCAACGGTGYHPHRGVLGMYEGCGSCDSTCKIRVFPPSETEKAP